ncbi:hypothetical protein C8Q76DRAFT_601064, partial [Earliella scabrosa]
VLSYLHPLDLIQVARTTRVLRTFVLSARLEWRLVRATIPTLPPCPSWMNELQYATLCFEKHC